MCETRNEFHPARGVYPHEYRTGQKTVDHSIDMIISICQMLVIEIKPRLFGHGFHRHERSALCILPAPYGMHRVTHFPEGILELLAAPVAGHLLHRSEIERIFRDLVISVLHQEGIVIEIPASGKIHVSK